MKIPVDYAIYTVALISGAISHVAVNYQKARKDNIRYLVIDGLTEWFISVFSGGMFGGFAYYVFGIDETVGIALFVATGAHLGLKGLEAIMNRAFNILIAEKKK